MISRILGTLRLPFQRLAGGGKATHKKVAREDWLAGGKLRTKVAREDWLAGKQRTREAKVDATRNAKE
jgi:hypothetical protein